MAAFHPGHATDPGDLRSHSLLSSRCRGEFEPAIRERGAAYQRGGRVRIEEAGAAAAGGRVRGSGGAVYTVEVLLPGPAAEVGDGDSLEVLCSCPHFARGELCKHLWAFLLELDARQVGPAVPGGGPVELYAADDFFAPGFEEEAEEELPSFERALWEHDASPAGDHGPWGRLGGVRFPAPIRASAPEVYYLVSLDRAGTSPWLPVRLFEPARSGGGRLRALRIRAEEIDARYAPADAEALRALVACTRESAYTGSAHWRPASCHESAIPPGLQPLLLPVLARTGRLLAAQDRAAPSLEALSVLLWQGEAGVAVIPRLAPGESPGAWQLEVELQGADAPRPADLQLVLPSGLLVAGDRILRLERPDLAGFVASFREHGAMPVEPNRLPDLLARIAELGLPPVELPEEIGWSYQKGVPTGRLAIRSADARTPQAFLHADVFFDYGVRSVPAFEPNPAFADREDRRLVQRDLAREVALLEQLESHGLETLSDTQQHKADVRLARRRLGEHVAALLELGWRVEADGLPVRRASTPRLSVATGVDWFDLESEVAFDEHVLPLPTLLAAAARGESMVALGDGSLGLLPSQWLSQMAPLAELGRSEGDRIRFLPSQALLLDALLEAQPEVDADAVFRRTCRRIERAQRPRAARVPRGLRTELRPYQRQGLAWLEAMGALGLGACLADDMGLGKTLQALALIALRRPSKRGQEPRPPSLAVVPASLVHNWLDEARRFAPGLATIAYTGPERDELRDRFPEADLVVTSYGTLRRDVGKLAGMRFDCVLLDEAQAVKNARSQVSKAARLLRAEQRVALSGTPVENHLGELWSLFDFLNPGMLGTSARRASTLAHADETTVAALAKAVGPFILRRTKQQVLADLPAKTEQTLFCTLSARERRLYRELRDHYRTSLLRRIDQRGMARSKIHVLEALLRLRQAACHPGLVDSRFRQQPSAKLDLLNERLGQALEEGHKALVFSQFTSLLALVREQLDAAGTTYEYLDGRTRKRGERVRLFLEDPDCRVFLVSLKAGGQGLNLTAADYVFLLDPWWNPAVEAQAIDRAHRIGQVRPVFGYRIIASETVEEKILELQDSKRRLAEAIVSGTSAGVRELTREDLEFLMS